MTHNNKPREQGTRWERQVVDYLAARYELPWDRAPLRGRKDLLDVQGSLPDGWLVGCKAKGPNAPLKLNEAMNETRAAVGRLPEHMQSGVIGVQVLQRPRYPVGRAYVVLELDDFARLVGERRLWTPVLQHERRRRLELEHGIITSGPERAAEAS